MLVIGNPIIECDSLFCTNTKCWSWLCSSLLIIQLKIDNPKEQTKGEKKEKWKHDVKYKRCFPSSLPLHWLMSFSAPHQLLTEVEHVHPQLHFPVGTDQVTGSSEFSIHLWELSSRSLVIVDVSLSALTTVTFSSPFFSENKELFRVFNYSNSLWHYVWSAKYLHL